MKPAQRSLTEPFKNRRERARRAALPFDREEIEQIVEAALLDRQRPVHIGFAEIEARSRGELPVQRRIVQPDRDARAGRAGEAVERPPASMTRSRRS